MKDFLEREIGREGLNEFPVMSSMAIWGPMTLLCTVALGIPLDFLFVAVVGLYLSARLHFRGCVYALILLFLSAVIKHTFFTSAHLWHLGLESSLACSFFITALAFEERALFLDSLHSQIEIGKATVAHLEEELARNQESAIAQQMEVQEKLATTQKELEELQTEYSSILILNEVLRKNHARYAQENENLIQENWDHKRQIGIVKGELAQLEKELAWVSNTEQVVVQNKELMNELNAARLEKAQTHLINETLARLYVRENLKAKEANEEAASMAEQVAAHLREIEKLRLLCEKANGESDLLKDRLQALDALARPPKTDPQLVEQLAKSQEQMVHLSQMEPLLKQLKKQFEEKNAVLAQTRAELFKTDTEMQALKMEKTALELNPLPQEVEEELQTLINQVLVLEEENHQLQELVTMLTDPTNDAAKRKKKLKTLPADSIEQEWLF